MGLHATLPFTQGADIAAGTLHSGHQVFDTLQDEDNEEEGMEGEYDEEDGEDEDNDDEDGEGHEEDFEGLEDMRGQLDPDDVVFVSAPTQPPASLHALLHRPTPRPRRTPCIAARATQPQPPRMAGGTLQRLVSQLTFTHGLLCQAYTVEGRTGLYRY